MGSGEESDRRGGAEGEEGEEDRECYTQPLQTPRHSQMAETLDDAPLVPLLSARAFVETAKVRRGAVVDDRRTLAAGCQDEEEKGRVAAKEESWREAAMVLALWRRILWRCKVVVMVVVGSDGLVVV